MSDHRSQRGNFLRRRNVLVDPSLQVRLGLQLTGVFLGVAAAYALAIYVLFDEASMQALSADEVRELFLSANLLYGGYAMVFLIAAGVWLLHGISGPALVIERAVRALTAGDFEARLSLRPRDRLVSLAAAVVELREKLQGDGQRKRELLAELASRIEAGELASAGELLEQLGHTKPGAGAA
jgi:methyl-accepting chemotaxis protein